MANQSKLKAWVRYDGTGRVISGGPIFQVNKPKVGNWKQIDANLCCNGTTGTTTTSGGGGTPTAWFGQISTTGNSDAWKACNGFGNSIIVYTATSTNPIAPGTFLYSNASLTTPIPYSSGSISIQGLVYEIVNGQTNPLGGDGTPCAFITTTTSTTQAPALSFIGRGGTTSNEACIGSNQTFYTTGPLQFGIYPQNGNTLYLDQALTQLVTYSYVSSPGIGVVFNCTNGVLSNQVSCF